MDAYLLKLETVLKAEFDGNVIPIPLKKGKKTPLYTHKEKKTENLWKMWKNKGFAEVLSETADLALLIRERAMVVVDFDDKEQAKIFEKNLIEFDSTVKESTKKGFHYFFKGTEQTKAMKLSNSVRPFGETCDVDIITTHENDTGAIIAIYPSENKEWINNIINKVIYHMPKEFIDIYNERSIKKDKKVQPKTEDEIQETKATNNKVDFEVLKEVVMSLKPTRADSFEYYWRDITFAILNIAENNGYSRKGNDLIHKFSEQSMNYNDNKVEKFIMNAGTRDDGFGLGTLLMYLKEDNEAMFYAIQEKLNPIKKVKLQGYAFIEEPLFDFFDGKVRDYDMLKKEFEKRHFKVMRPVVYVEELKSGDFYLRSPKDLKDAFGNVSCLYNGKQSQFLKHWLVDATIRTFETIEFTPPPLVCPRETFNMWRGFAIERIDVESSGNIQPFLDHLSILVNHDEKGVDYSVKFFADLVQSPGLLNGIALVLKSSQGAGKNLFLDFIHKILGKELYYETANPVQDLWGRFSLGRKNRLLINIDETSGKDTYPHAEQIKNMLTSPNYNYEQKGVNPITLTNYNRVVFTTNNSTPVKIEDGDRRFVVFECSDEKKGNKEYFDKLVAYFNDEANQKAVFEYLKSIDLSKVDWINDRPITEIYRDIQEVNTPIQIRFFKWLVEDNNDDTELRYSGMSFFDQFNLFLERCNYKGYSMTPCSFGRLVKKYLKIAESEGFIRKSLSKGITAYKIQVKDMRQWLIDNKHMMAYSIQDEDDEDF